MPRATASSGGLPVGLPIGLPIGLPQPIAGRTRSLLFDLLVAAGVAGLTALGLLMTTTPRATMASAHCSSGRDVGQPYCV